MPKKTSAPFQTKNSHWSEVERGVVTTNKVYTL